MEAQIIIREAHSEFGSTVMLVLHNLGLIAELCDEVVVMYAGEVVEHSDIRDIFFHPRNPYTRAVLECDPALELAKSRSFPTIPGDVPDLHSPPAGCVFAERCPRAEAKCNAESPTDSQVESNYGGIEHGVRCHFHASGPERKTRDNRVEAPAAEGAPPTAPVLSADEESETKLLSVNENDLRVRFRAMGLLKALACGTPDPFVDAVCDATISLDPAQTLGPCRRKRRGHVYTRKGHTRSRPRRVRIGPVQGTGIDRTLSIRIQKDPPAGRDDVPRPGRFARPEADGHAAADGTFPNPRGT